MNSRRRAVVRHERSTRVFQESSASAEKTGRRRRAAVEVSMGYFSEIYPEYNRPGTRSSTLAFLSVFLVEIFKDLARVCQRDALVGVDQERDTPVSGEGDQRLVFVGTAGWGVAADVVERQLGEAAADDGAVGAGLVL